MLTLTQEAAKAVSEIRAANDLPEGAGLRITAHDEGGDEVEIDLDFVEQPEEGDQVVIEGDARVFLDAPSAEILTDLELDVEPHGDHVHFQFVERPAD
jgi:iron-sulfur cluster assembly protein